MIFWEEYQNSSHLGKDDLTAYPNYNGRFFIADDFDVYYPGRDNMVIN